MIDIFIFIIKMLYDKYIYKLFINFIVGGINLFFLIHNLIYSEHPLYQKFAFLTWNTFFAITVYNMFNLVIHCIYFSNRKKLFRIYSSFFFKEYFKIIFIQSNIVFIMYWGLYIVTGEPLSQPVVEATNLYLNGFITVLLYVDIIFLNPHIMFNFEEKRNKTISRIKCMKLLKDYLIMFCCVTTYLIDLIIFRYTVDFYPYQFTQTYNLRFWLIMMLNLGFCYSLYFWYRFLSYSFIKLNSTKAVSEENMSTYLFSYINVYEGFNNLKESLNDNNTDTANNSIYSFDRA